MGRDMSCGGAEKATATEIRTENGLNSMAQTLQQRQIATASDNDRDRRLRAVDMGTNDRDGDRARGTYNQDRYSARSTDDGDGNRAAGRETQTGTGQGTHKIAPG
jgi:hypothetical protein